MVELKSIEDIKHCLYINLKERTDRKELFEKQFDTFFPCIPYNRFNAIKHRFGPLGCSMSHYRCLEIAKHNEWDHIMICEDDAKFINPEMFKRQIAEFFKNHKDDWDVLILGGNNFYPYSFVDNCCVRVNNCQTTTCYLVKQHYYDTLMENIKDGIRNLIQDFSKHVYFAIDVYWKKLQVIDRWFLLIPLTITQQEGFSDIENRKTNYDTLMLNLHKKTR